MTITKFSIEYDPINSRHTFTNGDTINGRIIVEASKETKISSLIFIARGKGRVCRTEQYGQNYYRTCLAHEKYYEVKQHILREARQDGTEVIGKGKHVFPFTFKIPDRNLPSSFKGSMVKIVHKMMVELKQSMRLTKKAKTHFTFVSKADMGIPELLEPRYDCKDKSLKGFCSGRASMAAHIERMGCKQGEPFQVTVEISNQSSRSAKPKFILFEKRSFFAQGHRNISIKEILTETSEPVASSSKVTVTKAITIPRELPPSILSSSIITLDYWLRVQLDIKYSFGPVIDLQIMVLPASELPEMKQLPASAGFGFEAFGGPNQAPWGTMPQQAVLHPEDPRPLVEHMQCTPPFLILADIRVHFAHLALHS